MPAPGLLGPRQGSHVDGSPLSHGISQSDRCLSLRQHSREVSSHLLAYRYAQVALVQRCISTEGLGGAAPHLLPFNKD